MREILFRGRRRDNGEWVVGCLVNGDGTFNNGKCYILPGIADFSYGDNGNRIRIGCFVEVVASTVGQYTGLTDKNGVKIFEGDIVQVLGNQQVDDWKNVNYTALIAYLDGGFCAIDGTIEEHVLRRYGLYRLDFDLEVIGNIHDTPELLEV